MACNRAHTGEICNLEIDYSLVAGNRILPFQIMLNLDDSVLNPGAGQNQKFCYTVQAVGQDNSMFADLNHLVLGICRDITEEQIKNITVVINGKAQDVVFGSGGNVKLRTPERHDSSTGCPGLEFDFPLNKVTGEMKLCFELTVPRAVGAIDTCLFGGNVTAQGLTICGPVCGEMEECPVVAYQKSTVCVPVSVTPFAIIGTPVTTCCGDPVITAGDTCANTTNVCRFTIRQQVCVAVPVEFGARAMAGT
ncbi:MAG: hypothetical protein ACI4PV_05865, partial [Butyricicoccus sp.]